MELAITRRTALKAAVAGCAATAAALIPAQAEAARRRRWHAVRPDDRRPRPGRGAAGRGRAVRLRHPRAQENELWDEMKGRGLGYLLVTHEYSAACMADGAARSTGRPGVICIVPGPGVTNALTGIAEALLDSVPMVCIIGDVARGDKYKPFQLHEIPQAGLIQQVTKGVFTATCVADIPGMVRQAFQLAMAGEPGPTAVVVPYNLLTETHHFNCPPPAPAEVPFDEAAFGCALNCSRNRRLPRRHLRRHGLHGLRRVADEGGGVVAGAGRHQRLRQGRHRRVPPAGRRLGLRAAGHAHRRERLQGRGRGAGRRRPLQRGVHRVLRHPAAPPSDPRRRQRRQHRPDRQAGGLRPRRRRPLPRPPAGGRRRGGPAA